MEDENMGEWISVDGELPEIDEIVFLRDETLAFVGCRCLDDDGERYLWAAAAYSPVYYSGRWECACEQGDLHPTHWHPFPSRNA